MKDRARHVRLANYRERLGGACVRRMNYQRQIERDCNAREAGEHHLRGVEHGRVPGALAAGAADWIDFMASNSPELREIFTGGMAWLDHDMQRRYAADFLDAKPEQQTAMLDLIGIEKNAAPENAAGIHFFHWARNLVLDAYYTSPIGIKELGYMGNTAVSEFHVPEEALQYALKRSPFA